MTAEELKSKIKIERSRIRFPYRTSFTGSLLLHSDQIQVENYSLFHHPEIEKFISENIREEIARAVYDDQRRELCEALDEFMSWHYPAGDYEKAEAARERLLKAARYQEAKSTCPPNSFA